MMPRIMVSIRVFFFGLAIFAGIVANGLWASAFPAASFSPRSSHGLAVRTNCSSNFFQLVLVHDVVAWVPSRVSSAKTTNLFKLLDLRSRMAILEATAEQRPGENPEDPAEQANSELLKTTTDSCNLCTDRQWFFSCALG